MLTLRAGAMVRSKTSDAIAYTYENSGRPCALLFFGAVAVPVWHRSFLSETRRATAIETAFKARTAALRNAH